MKKSIFLFFAAILCAMSTQGAPDLYVRGERNSWGAGNGDKMTEETTGSKWTYTSYWNTRSDFKIATDNWKNYNFGSASITNFGTAYTLTNDGSSGNMKFPSSMSTNGGLYKITVTKSGSSYKIKVDKLVEEGTSSYNIGANTHIYFNVAAASSEYDAASILLGHTGGSQDYAMEGKIEGTELFYKKMPKWDGFNTFCFIDANNWGGNWNGSERVTQRLPWATNTNKYNKNMSGGYHMFTVESGNDNANMTYTSNNSSYTDLLNKTQTIRVYVKKAGASSYTEVIDNWPGSITPDYYYMSSANATTHKSGETLTANASVTVSAVLTSQFKLVESSTILGYTFDGWGTTSTGPTENGNTYTIKNISGENEIYAFFSEITHTVTITNDGNGSTVPSGEQLNITEKDGIAISAEAAENFAFTSWTIVSGTGTFDTQNSVSTKFYPTSDATIQATFHSTITNSLSVVAGANVESVDGSTDPITLGESYEIKATPAYGYRFNQWTADPAENATFTDAASANTNVTVLNGSVTVTASAEEIMSTLTTSNTYNEGSPTIVAPTTSASEIGIETTATITAATDIDYTLASWTLENCIRTDGGAENATTITVKSNGNGAAATVTANYNIIPKITLYFVNSLNWATAKCHHWKDGGSTTTWPGDPMEVVSIVHGFDIYKVKFAELEHDLCIFNNDAGKQTGNLAVQDGKYYYPETDEWYATVAEIPTPCTDCSDYAIAGSMNDWSARRNRLKVTANNDIVELTLELTAGDYEFKIAGPEGWFGNSGKYEREHSGNAWTYRIKDDENNDEDNARIYIDMTGEYTFTWQISTKKLTITYPELPDFSQQTNTIFFRPSTDWKQADARFAAYFFGATEEKWVEMTDTDGDGIYEATNPKTNLSVKICRLDPDKVENKWDNVWNQSTNYEIPTGVENCWVVNDGEWDGATGIWTVLIGESDNSATLSAANSQTVNTLVNRLFTTDNLYTISLPFALDAEQVESIFGTGTILYQFAQLAKEGEELVLYFSKPSAIAAATPYLIQPKQDVAAGFIVEDATISTTLNNISFSVDATTVTMMPILSADRATTNGNTEYWLAADKILYNNANTLLSLRALFNISTVSGMPPRCRVALGENAETGVDNIINGENTTIKVIENGQLIIIRNGEKFNAQGVRL